MGRMKIRHSYGYERMRMNIRYGHTHTVWAGPTHAPAPHVDVTSRVTVQMVAMQRFHDSQSVVFMTKRMHDLLKMQRLSGVKQKFAFLFILESMKHGMLLAKHKLYTKASEHLCVPGCLVLKAAML
jgi:hypothetical protein